MPFNEAAVAATELERVDDTLPVLFERDDVFYSTVEKRPVQIISSREMRVPMEMKPGGRFGHYDPNGGTLGRGDGPTYDKAVINTMHFKYAVEYTKQAEWSTDNKRKAVIDAVKELTKNAMKEFRRNCDALCMTSGNGVVGTISANSTAAGQDTYTLNATGDGYQTRLIRDGLYYSVYNSTLTTRRVIVGTNVINGEAKAILVDPAAKQIKIDGATTGITNGDKLVVSGLSATPPSSLQGVQYHHDDASTGTWLGLDRAVYPMIRANRVTASASLALPFARLALNKIGDRVGLNTGVKAVAWMHPCQKQAYEELAQAVSIINKSAKEEGIDLYFGDNMQLAGCPIKTSYSWDKTRIDFIVGEVWGRAEYHPVGFYKVEGRRLFEVRAGDGGVATALIFYIVGSFNTFVNNPAKCSYISGLVIPAGY